jgi:hypothetical protein
MKLDVLARKLQDDGIGAMGKTIFLGNMPQDATKAIILKNSPLGTPIDPELPGYRKCRFHAAVRDETYSLGMKLAESVSKSLTMAEKVLPGMSIQLMRPVIEPMGFPLSDSNIFEFLVIFEAVYVIVE